MNIVARLGGRKSAGASWIGVNRDTCGHDGAVGESASGAEQRGDLRGGPSLVDAREDPMVAIQR